MPNSTTKTALQKYSEGTMRGTGLSAKFDDNPMYNDLFQANPYVNMTYHQSGWQTLLGKLGFRTDYDRWLEEAQANSNEYNAQVASIKQQNEFNDPSSEAQRMREAGLNPDLLGTQGVAESASPIQDPQGMSPGQSESGEFGEITQKLWNFGTGVLSCFQLATGFAKDMLSMRQMKNAVEGQDVGLAKDFMSFANDVVLQHAPAQPFEKDDEFRDYLDHIQTNVLPGVPKLLHFSRRQRRIWNSVVARNYFNSPDFERLTSSWKRSSENLRDIGRTPTGLKKFSADRIIGQDDWEAFNVVAKNLSQLADDTWQMQNKRFKAVSDAEISEAGVNKQVADAKFAFKDESTHLTYGQTVVLGDTSQNLLRYQTARVERAINSTMQRIVVELERQANDGDLLSAGLLLAFNIFRMSNWKVK